MIRRHRPDDYEQDKSGLFVPRHVSRGRGDFNVGPAFFGGAAGGDPHFSQVVTLLHMDGTNGSTTFTDNATAPLTWTAAGGASLETATPKWGTAAYTSGATAGSISSPNTAAMAMTNKDFCFECWVYITDKTKQGIIANKSNGSGNSPSIFIEVYPPNNQFYMASYHQPGVGTAGAIGPALANNHWYHVALYRISTVPGTSASLYTAIDGVVYAWGGVTNNFLSNDTTDNMAIGGIYSTGTNPLSGYIDDVRWTVGSGRYGSTNFTPPAGPFPNS